jgi:hypothetical protein
LFLGLLTALGRYTSPSLQNKIKPVLSHAANGAFENFPKHFIPTFQNQWSF